MNVIFVGVQGSGKGTQAKLISEKSGLCHVSSGDLLRGAEGELKEKVEEIINKGELISDELMIDILKERIKKEDCKKGVIFDGSPRNLNQARLLGDVVVVDNVVEIRISDEEALKRLSGRVSCKNCGAGYNLYTAPKPNNPEVCDKCDGKLIQRKDDNPEAIKKRIETYHNETEPVLEYYKDKVIVIDGEKEIEDISKDILEKLGF